jgi:hypothetical protein
MRTQMTVCLMLLTLAGCGRSSEERQQELDQQKLSAEMMKTQQEQMALMLEKEKKSLEQLKETESSETRIREQKRALDERQATLGNAEAQLKSRMTDMETREANLQSREEQIKALDEKNQAALRLIAAKNAEVTEKLAKLDQRTIGDRIETGWSEHAHALDKERWLKWFAELEMRVGRDDARRQFLDHVTEGTIHKLSLIPPGRLTIDIDEARQELQSELKNKTRLDGSDEAFLNSAEKIVVGYIQKVTSNKLTSDDEWDYRVGVISKWGSN